tara:strand:- start:13749 stop:16202 length:2454 start_codon:yes stop_codon:yes gene_type:complete
MNASIVTAQADVNNMTDGPITFAINGMSCAGCASSAEKALNGLDGIGTASVDFATERAQVSPGGVSAAALVQAVKDAGYTPETSWVDLDITGMTCSGCAASVERALENVPGVADAEVNLALERARVTWLGHDVATAALVDAVKVAGYGAQPRFSDAEARRQHAAAQADVAARALRLDALILAGAIIVTAPLVAMMVLPAFGVAYHVPAWAQMALATPVQFIAGARFYVGAWRAVKARSGNMDQLVALGTSAAYALSVWMMLNQGINAVGHLYFEASAVVITLVLAGKLLESRAKRGTTAAIRKLMDLRPERARVQRDGNVVEVAIEQVQIGDTVVVMPGARIPVDGTLTSGRAEVDESLLTGESVPIAKTSGDMLRAGAINGSNEVHLSATRIGEDTTLARIVRLVESAQTGKAPVQRLVDKVSAIFVPSVIAIAAVSLISWLVAGAGAETAIINAVSVLVIACPCALGLATPTAIVAGTGAAAKAGILIKDIGVLERAHALDVVAFDKTGTLTKGAPALTDIVAYGRSEDDMLRIAAAVQTGSEHPLARAVLAAAEARDVLGLKAEDVLAHVGSGVEGRVDGARVLIGNRGMMKAVDINIDAKIEGDLARIEKLGRTAVLVAIGNVVSGVIGLADTVRSETPLAMRMLAQRGIQTVMLSGDGADAAKAIASEAGLADVRAGLTPDSKVDAIHELQGAGRIVAMVGDGINDAPALAAADVGIAMGSGTDVAMESAGITLMRPDPRLVAGAIDAARVTWNRIRWNLFWAFIFNVVGLPLAALGYLSPEVAGLAMALSSITVVTNSLLLRGWKPKGMNA